MPPDTLVPSGRGSAGRHSVTNTRKENIMSKLRERRHAELVRKLERTNQHREAAIATLIKCDAEVKALRRAIARNERAAARTAARPPTPAPVSHAASAHTSPPSADK